MSDKIYDMKLHDVIELDANIRLLRVAGGWVYTFCYNTNGNCTSSFVPYDTSFECGGDW